MDMGGRVCVEVVVEMSAVPPVEVGDHYGLPNHEPRWFFVSSLKRLSTNNPGMVRLRLSLRESSYLERLAWDVMTA